jgi:hypothetical protein
MRKTKNKKGNKLKRTRKYKGGENKCGTQTECPICNGCYKSFYNKTIPLPGVSLCNCPNYGDSFHAYYEDHVRTHPLCIYCSTQQMNLNVLADHIKENHNDKFIIAQRIKPGFDNKNLIDELKTNNSAFIGVLPEITKFYENISKAEKEAEQKLIKKAKQANAAEEKIKAASEKKAAKELEESIRVKKAEEKAEEEAKKKEALKEEQRIKREQAEAKKALALAKENEEKELALAKANEEKAKKALLKKENKNMEIEDALSRATNIDDIIVILESAETTPELELEPEPEPIVQSPIFLPPLIKNTNAIPNLFPYMKHFKFNNVFIDYQNAYKNINYCVMFNIGIINAYLKINEINLKFILKGGKVAQMLSSRAPLVPLANAPSRAPLVPLANAPSRAPKVPLANAPSRELLVPFKNECIENFCSNDIDILMVQDGVYDRDFLLQVAKQFADNIQNAFGSVSILDPSSPELLNKNIIKVSYTYPGTLAKFDNVKGEIYFPNEFIPICDIDCSKNNSNFFNDIVETYKMWDGNHLLYYYQSRESFIAEKRHYYDVYKEISQKMPDSETVCDCSKHPVDAECKPTCSYRNVMLQKFKRYLDFF